jgi:RsiW-degrading membrane proteinase PrsW (M82 family)
LTRVRTVIASEHILVLALVGLVGLAYLAARLLDLPPIALSPLVALTLAGVPALIWLTYFYTQDRHEPEPKHFVAGTFILGAFVAGPISDTLIDLARPHNIFATEALNTFTFHNICGAILVVGLAQELCKYASVRYSVYMSDEFDEPVDGIIYMTAAGIGFATYTNFRYLTQGDGSIYIDLAVAHSVVSTLAHACFAGVLGYFLGRAKFGAARPRLLLSLALLGSATLNGGFALMMRSVSTSAYAPPTWRSVSWATGFSFIVFVVLTLLVRRHLDSSPHRPQEEAEA